MAKSNQNAATEDEVGLIHKGITRAYGAGISWMLRKLEEAEEIDDPLERDAAFAMALNDRLLSSATKWVQANEVTCAAPEETEGNKLSNTLKSIKDKQAGKVLSFSKEA